MNEFRILLNKYKTFRNLPDIYKTDKFLLLYSKIYEYMKNIPKDEIVYKLLIKDLDILYYGLLNYIECFLKAKDFYNWRYRVYELMTKKLHNPSKAKWELLYNSKAEEYWNEHISKMLNTFEQSCITNFGCKNPMQSKEVQEKSKQTMLERHGVEHALQSKEVQEKMKKNIKKKYNTEYYMQSKDFRDKSEAAFMKKWGVKSHNQAREVKEKKKKTFQKRYNVNGPFQLAANSPHSKIADDFCINLYNKIPNIECIFFKKDNKEYNIENKYYDFCIPDLKVIIEFDGLYWHGLQEGQKDVLGKPVEEVWKEDREKQKLAEDNGFTVIRVREDEYKKDKEKCIQEVLKKIGYHLDTL